MTMSMTDSPATRVADPGGPAPAPPPPPSGPGGSGRPPRRTRLWSVVGGVAAVALLAGMTYDIVGQIAHEEFVVTSVVTDPVTTLEVDQSADGDVHVVGADVAVVTITARVSQGLRRSGHAHRVIGDRLVVRASCPTIGSSWCSVDYVIEVPRNMAVVIGGGGSVVVEGVAGRVSVESAEGSIQASGLGGPVLLRSTSGSVRATDLRSEVVDARSTNGSVSVSLDVAPTSVVARTINGSAEVLVPRTEDRYAVDVDAVNGSPSNEVVSDPSAPRRLTARSINGSARVAYHGP